MNKPIQRYEPIAFGNPNVTPYAMMISSDNGNWVEYKEYEKLKKKNTINYGTTMVEIKIF
jgi:hypothetical protein